MASSTYGALERQYLLAAAQMERMVAKEASNMSKLDDTLGLSTGPAIKAIKATGNLGATIADRRRSAVMANDESMAALDKGAPKGARLAVSSESHTQPREEVYGHARARAWECACVTPYTANTAMQPSRAHISVQTSLALKTAVVCA